MGRVIINFQDGSQTSLKCKSRARAREIIAKRPNTINWEFYSTGTKIYQPRKQAKQREPISLQEMEAMIKRI